HSSANFSSQSGSTVDPAEVAKFSKLSDEWWDPNGKMAPLHKVNPLRLSFIRAAARRNFARIGSSMHCMSGQRILDFFQAEDGIRDWSVTGVQTCALLLEFRRVLF